MSTARARKHTGFGPVLTWLILLPSVALAQGTTLPPGFGPGSLVELMCQTAGYNCDPRDEAYFVEVAGLIAFALLTYLGVIFMMLIVYGGFRWMLARGNESEVIRAKAIIRHAVTGLVVTLAAFSIWKAIEYFLL